MSVRQIRQNEEMIVHLADDIMITLTQAEGRERFRANSRRMNQRIKYVVYEWKGRMMQSVWAKKIDE